ncbi:unnamed protein product [Cyprideis torosa]|uniref:RING-type E3 ubiquitin transferase n=1 Tax=Cyprideis torosa TaxID=163714 RepID=A0A7R8W7U0_9CRUS|nr:unnamed protein product [Cyprideis torosa]CAG0882762.1 unnamed protein product [Cyprideis torosa]
MPETSSEESSTTAGKALVGAEGGVGILAQSSGGQERQKRPRRRQERRSSRRRENNYGGPTEPDLQLDFVTTSSSESEGECSDQPAPLSSALDEGTAVTPDLPTEEPKPEESRTVTSDEPPRSPPSSNEVLPPIGAARPQSPSIFVRPCNQEPAETLAPCLRRRDGFPCLNCASGLGRCRYEVHRPPLSVPTIPVAAAETLSVGRGCGPGALRGVSPFARRIRVGGPPFESTANPFPRSPSSYPWSPQNQTVRPPLSTSMRPTLPHRPVSQPHPLHVDLRRRQAESAENQRANFARHQAAMYASAAESSRLRPPTSSVPPAPAPTRSERGRSIHWPRPPSAPPQFESPGNIWSPRNMCDCSEAWLGAGPASPMSHRHCSTSPIRPITMHQAYPSPRFPDSPPHREFDLPTASLLGATTTPSSLNPQQYLTRDFPSHLNLYHHHALVNPLEHTPPPVTPPPPRAPEPISTWFTFISGIDSIFRSGARGALLDFATHTLYPLTHSDVVRMCSQSPGDPSVVVPPMAEIDTAGGLTTADFHADGVPRFLVWQPQLQRYVPLHITQVLPVLSAQGDSAGPHHHNPVAILSRSALPVDTGWPRGPPSSSASPVGGSAETHHDSPRGRHLRSWAPEAAPFGSLSIPSTSPHVQPVTMLIPEHYLEPLLESTDSFPGGQRGYDIRDASGGRFRPSPLLRELLDRLDGAAVTQPMVYERLGHTRFPHPLIPSPLYPSTDTQPTPTTRSETQGAMEEGLEYGVPEEDEVFSAASSRNTIAQWLETHDFREFLAWRGRTFFARRRDDAFYRELVTLYGMEAVELPGDSGEISPLAFRWEGMQELDIRREVLLSQTIVMVDHLVRGTTEVVTHRATSEGTPDEQPNEGSSSGDYPRCAICLDSFVDGVDVRRLPCQHIFHLACVDRWIFEVRHLSCPFCRRTLWSFPHLQDRLHPAEMFRCLNLPNNYWQMPLSRRREHVAPATGPSVDVPEDSRMEEAE